MCEFKRSPRAGRGAWGGGAHDSKFEFKRGFERRAGHRRGDAGVMGAGVMGAGVMDAGVGMQAVQV
jgi:hypothetical protein